MFPFRFLQTRFLLRTFLLLVVFGAITRIAAPYLLPSAAMERELKSAISAWTGTEFTSGSPASFSFWPYPQVRIEQIRLKRPADAESTALMEADSISATFSLLGSAFGEPDFDGFEIVRPVFTLAWDDTGTLNWPRSAWMERAVADAADRDEDRALPHSRIGTVTLVDARISVDNRKRKERYEVTDVNGTIRWPGVSGRLDVTLRGVLKGEVATWTLETNEPLKLVAGENAAITTAFTSDPLTVGFEGIGNLSANAFISGKLQLHAPSISHLLDWRGADLPGAAELGGVSLEATVTTAGHTAKLDDLTLRLQESQATGVLDVALPGGTRPSIGGTLAFDTVDLATLYRSLTAPAAANGPDDRTRSIPQRIGLDLRLSARQAALSPVTLNDLAAGIRTDGPVTSLDIGDAAIFGGRMNGRLTLVEHGQRGGQMQLSFNDVDLGALSGAFRLVGPLPTGRSRADITLSSSEPLDAFTGEDLSGTFRIAIRDGVIPNFDQGAFLDLASKSRYFRMSDAADGSFAFAAALIQGKIDRGLAEIDKATFEGTDKHLDLSGVIPYRSGSLALAGTLADKPGASGVTTPSTNFFVGGAWPEPLISPISVLTRQPQP
ncbi:AsmA family protein [Rhizobium sp. TRM95111]|uniref:AsmA family protein n=1 Tax=Rhizobium alarense TaxID=2846851 RepID=UPI001F34B9D7|nr:AsmA-like C-terminal region-containing protein [Rhizobium alarense]MCF3639521.1 AsmA family protein [Rhizobium alarense]